MAEKQEVVSFFWRVGEPIEEPNSNLTTILALLRRPQGNNFYCSNYQVLLWLCPFRQGTVGLQFLNQLVTAEIRVG